MITTIKQINISPKAQPQYIRLIERKCFNILIFEKYKSSNPNNTTLNIYIPYIYDSLLNSVSHGKLITTLANDQKNEF